MFEDVEDGLLELFFIYGGYISKIFDFLWNWLEDFLIVSVVEDNIL